MTAVLPYARPMTLRQRWLFVNQTKTFTARLRERFGPIAFFKVNGEPFDIVLTTEGVRQILSTDPACFDAFWKEAFTGLTGPMSLWVLGGEAHRRERQLVAPAFHARNYRGLGETIRDITRHHIGNWQAGETVRAIDTTLAISLDVIMRLVFGAGDEACLLEGRQTLSALLHAVHPAIVFFPKLQRRWFPPWARFFRAKERYAAWLNRYLAVRRARSEHGDDVLGRLLAAQAQDGGSRSDTDIGDQLVTILLAGHETTATALAWALYELGRRPDVLAKLRAELESTRAEADPGLIVNLPYLSAVCNETLRLHTLLTDVPRMCVAPVECLGYTLPPGHAISVSIISIHHDPALYPEPDRFVPERFIERSYSAFEFVPFGGGDRRCLGAGLSDYEMRIALAEIALRWDFEPAAVELDIRHDIAMGPKHGVPLRIKSRRQLGHSSVFSVAREEAVHA
jgi:cytochrome P450